MTAEWEAEREELPQGGAEEEHLARVFEELGPFLAIGDPNDGTFRYGATRKLIQPRDDWRQAVSDLMAKARVVVFHVGISEGVIWELQKALSSVSPHRLLLLVSSRKDYDRFRRDFGGLFTCPLPRFTTSRPFFYIKRLTTIHGAVYFQSNGNPQFLPTRCTLQAYASLDASQHLSGMLKKTLQPFFVQLEECDDLPTVVE